MSTNTAMQTGCLENKRCELHEVLRRPMQLCRGFGLFPVEGLGDENITRLKFNIKSLYALYYVLTLLCQTVMAGFAVYNFHINDLDLETIKCVAFFVNSFVSAVLMSKLAKNWPRLIRKASRLENRVAVVRTNRQRYEWVALVVMLLGALEHILSVIFQIKFIMVCNHDFDFDFDLMRCYYSRVFVFKIISFSDWKAVIYKIVAFQSTFLWNITDALTMSISLYLASYFKDLNKLIERQEKQNLVNWKEIRQYYSHLVELVNAVDSNMCFLILMASFSDLFFICTQLFHLSNFTYPVIPDCSPDDVKLVFTSFEHSMYYAFSFFLIFMKATMTSLLAANINTVAQRPLLVLQNVSSSDYTIEVQRFIRQIRYTTTALSGFCFDITKGMILAVFATVIKYELVIFQFSTTE